MPITIDVVVAARFARPDAGIVGNLTFHGENILQSLGLGLCVGNVSRRMWCVRSTDRLYASESSSTDQGVGYVRLTGTYDPASGVAESSSLGSSSTEQVGAYMVERRPILLGAFYGGDGSIRPSLKGRIAWVHIREGLPPWPAPPGPSARRRPTPKPGSCSTSPGAPTTPPSSRPSPAES